MASYGYSTPFQGFQQGLPAGYMQAATDPGRNIGAGISQFGDGIASAIEKYKNKKAETEYTDQKNADMFQMIQSIAQQGNLMDHKSPESELVRSVMGFTGQKDLNKLGEYAVNSPGLTLAKKKALAHDLEFALSRYDTRRVTDSNIAAQEALTQQRQQEMAIRQDAINQQNLVPGFVQQALAAPTEVQAPEGKVTVGDAPASTAPAESIPISKSQQIQEAMGLAIKMGFKNPPMQLINQIADLKNQERLQLAPDMVVDTQTIDVPGYGKLTAKNRRLEELDMSAKQQHEIALAQAKAKNTPLTEFQSKALSFARDMSFNENIIKDLDKIGYDGSSITDQAWKWSPDLIKKENRRDYEAAKSAWSDGLIRSRTGAAASKSEVASYNRDYFPEPGDSARVIKNKRLRRENSYQSMLMQAGEIPPASVTEQKLKVWNRATQRFE